MMTSATPQSIIGSLGWWTISFLHTFNGPMVLNPHGFEPTFLKLDSWSPEAGFMLIITQNVLN